MKTVWEKLNDQQFRELMDLSEDYKKFLDEAKTEREAVDQSIILAKKAGFKEYARNASGMIMRKALL